MIKANPVLRTIPVVVVVTTSANPRDVDFCYSHGANAHHVKPVRYPDHLHVLTKLLEYWRVVVSKPALQKTPP